MTNHEATFAKMARLTFRELTDQRPQWEARSPQMTADFELLRGLLEQLEPLVSQAQGHKGGGAERYLNAHDDAEHRAEAAANDYRRAGTEILQLAATQSRS